ncbi:hypothetical protein ACOMHN_018576 [Nucella lapillus]
MHNFTYLGAVMEEGGAHVPARHREERYPPVDSSQVMTSSGDVYRRAESGEPPSSPLLDTRGARERLQRYVYREDHPPLASRGNFVPPQDVTGVQHGNGFSETTTRSAILQLTSTGNLLPPHREARMQHGVNHTVTSTLGGLLSLAHRLAQVHQRMTSTRGPRPGSEWTNLPPPLHLTDGRHGIFGVTSTRKGHLPLQEAPFLAWKGGPSFLLLPRAWHTGTQGRPQRHVYTGTGGRNSPRDATLAEWRASTGRGEDPLCRHPDSKARGARGGPDTSRQTGLSDYLPWRKSTARAMRGGGRQSSVSDSDRNLRPTSVRLSKKI